MHSKKDAAPPLPEGRGLRRAENDEGELIPLPQRCLRIIGNAYDMYQILKMIANPNLAHKINFVFNGEDMKNKAGGNSLDMCLFFFGQLHLPEGRGLEEKMLTTSDQPGRKAID